jgi:membrane-associated protease RseP (regulator of RpoE activity)
MITAIIVLVALGVLGWGFYRARPDGKLGIFSWLQSVILMAPWLIFFGLFSARIYLNLVGMLLLFLASTGIYIALGQQVRQLAQAEVAKQAAALAAKAQAAKTETAERSESGASVSPTDAPAAAPEPGSTGTATLVAEIVPIPAVDVEAIKGIFSIDTFFATQAIPYQEGAVFNGNLRGEPAATYARLSERLQQRLGDRYRLFLIENPEQKPTVVIVPSSADPPVSTPFQKVLAGVLFLATVATCCETAGILQGFDFYAAPGRYREVLPIAFSLVAVLIAHEVGHWFMSRRYQVKLSWPFFLPTWQIGSFGALTRFESLLPNRTALFDIAVTGPATGGLLSIGLLIAGLLLSHSGSALQVPTVFFEGSILVGTLARVVLQESLQQATVDLHPLVVVGWLGLLINAINLMPAGRLDGGRVVQAIYGRKIANRTTVATLIVLGLVSLVNPLALYWVILILVLQRTLERPSLEEISEPDDTRAALALLALFLMVATLLPLTPSLAGKLGIGG